jgi:CMP-2-keto-3-deoxyoctulosonic acid synthetase
VKIIGIISDRFGSACLPGKPLARIAGKSLIQLVLEQGQVAKSLVFAAGDGICVGVDLLQNKYEL